MNKYSMRAIPLGPAVVSMALLLYLGCTHPRPSSVETRPSQKFVFKEIWAYLMRGEENRYGGDEPITDLFYFSARIGVKGRLSGAVAPPPLGALARHGVRVHLVVSELSNPSLTHFSLDPDLPVRDLLIDDIVSASAGYAGVQIDFESVLPDDAATFRAFLSELKKRLPRGALLSIAVPARSKKVDDAYEYGALSLVADRLMIMAYDQHWSTSKPGPVASAAWCKGIIAYAKSVIPAEKLVMGLPLYGRAWSDKNQNRSLHHRHVMDIVQGKKIKPKYSHERGHHFEYKDKVKVAVYYEDTASIVEKIKLYHEEGVSSIAFWRMGQGPAALWRFMSLEQ